jgi:tight adherence protein C
VLLVLGILFIAGAVGLGAMALNSKQGSLLEARMATLRGEARAIDYKPPQNESITVRVLGPMGESLGRRVSSILPASILRSIDQRLVQAGQPISTGGFLGAVALLEGAMFGMGFLLAMSMGGFHGQSMLIAGTMPLLGFVLARTWLENRVRTRQHEIIKSLPDAFDLITTCVEAGLGLDAALSKVAEKVQGPFADELALMSREVSLGKLRRDALKDMADRVGVPDLTIFINAVVQAETMGTSIATVLRVQADQMRVRRRQRAEAQAYKAPVKMVFPLVLCIFPTLFLVILGPAAISLYDTLVKGNIGK